MTRQAGGAQAAPPRELGRSLYNGLVWGGLVALLVWSWNPAEMYRVVGLFTDGGNMVEYASGFLKPAFRDWRYYVDEMILTVQIATWGTVLAVVAAFPLGILSASNMAP